MSSIIDDLISKISKRIAEIRATAFEEAASLHESVSPASDAERVIDRVSRPDSGPCPEKALTLQIPFAPRGAHDLKVWVSLSREQQKWVAGLLIADQFAVDVRESVACGWAFEHGRVAPASVDWFSRFPSVPG